MAYITCSYFGLILGLVIYSSLVVGSMEVGFHHTLHFIPLFILRLKYKQMSNLFKRATYGGFSLKLLFLQIRTYFISFIAFSACYSNL